MTQKDEIDIHEKAIEELKRTYDIISDAYGTARTKILTFIASIFALLAYLYADNNEGIDSFNNLFIPAQAYGTIFTS